MNKSWWWWWKKKLTSTDKQTSILRNANWLVFFTLLSSLQFVPWKHQCNFLEGVNLSYIHVATHDAIHIINFVGSLLCSEKFFPGYSGFPLSSKNQHLIQFDLINNLICKHDPTRFELWNPSCLNKRILLLLLLLLLLLTLLSIFLCLSEWDHEYLMIA